MGSCRRLLPVLLMGLLNHGCASDSVLPRGAPPLAPSATADATALVDSDVVVVIDYSSIGLIASGIDVNQNGEVGRNRSWANVSEDRLALPPPGWAWTSDSGDAVAALQIEIAGSLVPRLADRRNRIGLLVFTLRARSHARGPGLSRMTDKPAVRVPVGPSAPVLSALAELPPVREHRRTDLARLLALAEEMLDEAEPVEPPRPRVILLLSPAPPSAPDGVHWASTRALEFADELGQRGVVVFAVPCRAESELRELPDAMRQLAGTRDELEAYLHRLTAGTGGRVLLLDELDAFFAGLGQEEAAE